MVTKLSRTEYVRHGFKESIQKTLAGIVNAVYHEALNYARARHRVYYRNE